MERSDWQTDIFGGKALIGVNITHPPVIVVAIRYVLNIVYVSLY